MSVGPTHKAAALRHSDLSVDRSRSPSEDRAEGVAEGAVDLGHRRLDAEVVERGDAVTAEAAGDDAPVVLEVRRDVERDAVVRRPRAAELAALMPAKAAPGSASSLLSPMPGRVVSIAAEAGQDVRAGEALAVVEAMKMENVLRAERDGRVAKVVAAAGDSIGTDQVILELELPGRLN